MIVLTEAEALVEAAYELLGAEPERHGHRECPGCTLLVHHTRTLGHAGECGELLAIARATPEAP